MDDVWNFAGEMVSFVENTDWVMMACPFGELLFLLRLAPSDKFL